MRTRVFVTVGAALALLAACTGGAGDRVPRGDRTPPPSAGSTAPPDEPRTAVRMLSPPGGSFLVRGRFPRARSRCIDPEQPKLLARYPDTVRVRRAPDGTLALTLTLPFERYLEGIAEVPSSWPSAALEAQAIAARSYALATTGWSGEEGETLDEPICATAACQVYRGIPVPRDPSYRRWVRAVRRTSGQVLLHDGRPATTVYFSTSNGRTYGNDEVFGSDPLPYLRPVVERDDGASQTSRWSVRLPLEGLRRFLSAGDLWPAGRRISAVRARDDDVLVRGGGAERAIGLDELRDAVNTWAPCLAPRRYPGGLPLTVPSLWLRATATQDALVLTGRGWGHGVGMVQWGAYGKARRGFTAERILGYYYGGLLPRPYPEPGSIDVVVASGLTRLTVVPSEPGARLDGQALDGPVVIVPSTEGLSVST